MFPVARSPMKKDRNASSKKKTKSCLLKKFYPIRSKMKEAQLVSFLVGFCIYTNAYFWYAGVQTNEITFLKYFLEL